MKLYSYILARDYGFSPNPFYGCCTLATCKTQIRKMAQIGDWVIGTGASTKYHFTGRLIYAMKVNEVMSFDEILAQIARVTPDEIKVLANTILPRPSTLALVGPFKSASKFEKVIA